jgi:hypothetical protein
MSRIISHPRTLHLLRFLIAQKKHRHRYLIALTTTLILYPLIRHGYFLRLDYLAGPHPWVGGSDGNFVLIPRITQLLHAILPMWIIEKMLFIVYFITLGAGGRALSRTTQNPYAITCSILLMICNPVVYSRWIDGQMNVSRFVAIVPFWLLALRRLFAQPDRKKSVIVAIIAGLWMGISLHASYFILVSFIILCVAHLCTRLSLPARRRKSIIGRSLFAGVCILIASSYVLVPLLQHTTTA